MDGTARRGRIRTNVTRYFNFIFEDSMDLQDSLAQITAALKAAVLAERDRCIQVIRDCASNYLSGDEMAEVIVDRIRRG